MTKISEAKAVANITNGQLGGRPSVPATCIGSVRGWCGVVHRSLAVAKAHVTLDGEGCAEQGGYSDRRAVTARTYDAADYAAMTEEARAQLGID